MEQCCRLFVQNLSWYSIPHAPHMYATKILDSTKNKTRIKNAQENINIASKVRRIHLYFLSFTSLIAMMFFKIGDSSGTSTSKLLAKSRREGKVISNPIGICSGFSSWSLYRFSLKNFIPVAHESIYIKLMWQSEYILNYFFGIFCTNFSHLFILSKLKVK